MECIEARALKSSFLSQMGMMKTNSSSSSSSSSQQVHQYDDAFAAGGNSNSNNVVGCDDFPVEDLLNLDFNGKDLCFSAEEEEEDGDDVAEEREKISYSSSCSTFSSVVEDSLSVGELAVPYDDLENLEWLSQFVDDSTSNLSTLLYPIESFTKKPGSTTSDRSKQASSDHPMQVHAQCFPVPFPRRLRNKRSRSSEQCWSSSSQPLIITTSSSSSSLSSNGSSPFPFANQFHNADGSEYPPTKKQKRKNIEPRTGSNIGRRCAHCQVQKTPQWRTGPLGPKTLCNACGVRYKSGRLFPEYLPACSPLFSQEVHSNSHRKVLELRRKKEMVGSAVAEPALARVVPSC